jgi:hypothetical protein
MLIIEIGFMWSYIVGFNSLTLGDMKLKKRIYPLIIIALLTVTCIIPAVFADAALTNERFREIGYYDIVAAGVGLEGVTDGTISLNIPPSGNSEVVVAYLYWSGYDPITGGDDEVDFEGTPVTVLDSFGPDLWYDDHYTYVYVADVTSDVQTGNNDYDIEGVEFDRNFGAGLIAVYESDDLPLAEAIILDGLDNYWFGWPDPRGPNSEVTSLTFDPATISRTAEMILIAGATEHDDRPNELWTETGTGPAPLPTDNLITAPSTPPDGDYPFVGSDGIAWDTYMADVSIPADDEWLALQVESVNTGDAGPDPPHEGRGTSGILIAGGFVLTIPQCGLSPGFWKHNVRIALGYPGHYSVPHEGEPRMNYDKIVALAEDATLLSGTDALEAALAALTAKGSGSAMIRLAMANAFNAAAGYTPYSD